MAEDTMQRSNLDVETALQGDVTTDSSTDAFFNALESDVNSAVTHNNSTTTEQVTPPIKGSSNTGNSGDLEVETNPDINWEKRYSDSTREAQRLSAELTNLEPLKPLLEVMKKDPNLIPYIRTYLESGGKPDKTVKDKLELPEDFVFDPHEAVTDPESNSAKVMNQMVNKQVEQRVKKYIGSERKRVQGAQVRARMASAEKDFKARHKMSDEDYKAFQGKAKGHRMTLDDAYYLVNRDKVQKNVANASKEDALRQMKNVREIPTTQAGSNNAGSVKRSQSDEILDVLKGLDGNVDGLFE